MNKRRTEVKGLNRSVKRDVAESTKSETLYDSSHSLVDHFTLTMVSTLLGLIIYNYININIWLLFSNEYNSKSKSVHYLIGNLLYMVCEVQ